MTHPSKSPTPQRRITRSDVARSLLYGRLGIVVAVTVVAAAIAYLAFSEPV